MNKHQWPLWCLALYAHLGEREMSPGDNGAIMSFFQIVKALDAPNDEVPWCAAGVGADLERVGIPSTRSLMAKSYLYWGTQLARPAVGAVAVFDRPPDPSLGHVSFAVWPLVQVAAHLTGARRRRGDTGPTVAGGAAVLKACLPARPKPAVTAAPPGSSSGSCWS